MVEQRGEMNLADLQHQTDELIRKANQQPEVTGLFTVYKANSPQLFADVDREKCLKHGVALADVFATLQACLGSRYVNDFNRFGRTWQVIVQADSQFRDDLSDVHRLKVRNRAGKMVPLGAVADFQLRSGPLVLSRYNMYPAAAIQGNVSAGYSTGQAIAMLENLAGSELPAAMASEWTEITYLERISRNTGMFVFGLSVAFVFLVLAALYESWSLPLAVILVVPMCVLCSLLGVDWARMDVNIFTQIGFVVLIGLACKNAILIVEFAKSRREAGADCRTATLHACELRLRPILMTSLAFILGVVPLVIARGAGAEMRRTLGTAVFSGMLGVTLFGIFLTPVFFLVIDQASEWPMFRTRWPGRWSRHLLDLLRLSFLWRPWSDQVRQIVRGLRTPQASPTGDQTQASPRDLRLPAATDESLTGSIQRLASSLTELSPPEPDPHTLGSPSS
jgi:multidrug efflux pump